MPNVLPQNCLDVLDSLLGGVKDRVIQEVLKDPAAAAAPQSVYPDQVAVAARQFARTQPFPEQPRAWDQIINVPGIIWVSAILALAFAAFGYFFTAPALYEITKVLAGAIVGAIGAKK